MKLKNTGMIARIVFLFLCLFPVSADAGEEFNDFFTDGVMRFDYLLTGTNNSVRITEVQQKKEPVWGGKTYIQITDQMLGNYRFRVKDKATNTIIFQQGFSPLFQEWQTTAEAKKMEKSFYQVLRFPFPKNKVELEIACRNRKGQFQTIYQRVIDPADYFISREAPFKIDFQMIRASGDPSQKVDIAILAEGYKADEMGKFVKDAGRMIDSLFLSEPFASYKEKFNIYALKSASQESGTDIPGKNVYVNTLYNSTFYTFDIARYLTTTDLKSVYDQAAAVPYDYLIVLVNSTEYGGGGFYNYLSVCTSDHILATQVFIHEFGHEFAGLGDEYYSSQVAYEEYYNLKVEPWEPNLTTLVDFKSKWNYMVDRSTPVPTPRTAEYAGKVGVFEGGGYVARGIYSPMDDCRMKSNKPNSFCPVCQKAIQKVIIKCTE